jgi:hypothetical protein
MTLYDLVFLFIRLRKRTGGIISQFRRCIFAANVEPQFKKLLTITLYCNGQCRRSVTKLFKNSAVIKTRYSLRTDCLPLLMEVVHGIYNAYYLIFL